jgi:hypothetical protein
VRALFAAAAEAIATGPQRALSVSTDGATSVLIEGRELAASAAGLEAALPPGRYRVWAVRHEQLSAPRVVDLGDAGASVRFGPTDWALHLVPVVGVDGGGGERCGRALAEICGRAGVTRCLALGATAEQLGDVAPGPMALEAVALPAARAAVTTVAEPRHPAFSPWFLVPFGAGQLAQDRPAVGAAFLTGELALGIWHGIALSRHRATTRGDAGDEETWRGRRNVSAGLFYTALLIGVGEALVHGAVDGD